MQLTKPQGRIAAAAWLAAAGMALSLAAPPAAAQTYPNRPIRFIIPFAPGGGNDIVSRVICQQLAAAFGQSVLPDNRAGAGGTIGTDLVAKATPDGYTLGMGSTSTFSINPWLVKDIPYDAVKDFTPITVAASNPYVLAVHPSVPARNLAEFVALAKARPGSLHFGSAGNGSTIHLAGEIFKSMAGVDMVHVPYKGMGPAITDLLGGQVETVFATLIAVTPAARSGQVRLLGISSPKRSPLAPDLPTFDEAGIKGYFVAGWFGVVAPAKTPRSIIDRLYKEILVALHSKPVTDRLVNEGADVGGNTPAEFAALIKTDLAKWGKAVKDAKVTLE